MMNNDLQKKIRYIELKSRKLVDAVFSGNYSSFFKGKGINFSETREYQDGDDSRFIDWNVTARFDRPFIKLFDEERELNIILIIDASGSSLFSSALKTKLEISSELCAIFALATLRNNDKIEALLFTDTVEKYLPRKRGRLTIFKIIRELLTFSPVGKKTNIAKAVEFILKTTKKKSFVILISDFIEFDFDAHKELQMLNIKHDLTAIIINDRLEKHLPRAGIITFKNPETNETCAIDTNNENILNKINSTQSKHFVNLKNSFTKSDIEFIEISTGGSYIEPLIKHFRRLKRRK